MVEEGLAPDLGALQALAFEVALDDHLRGDARMVGADDPQRILAEHPLTTREHVLQRDVERVADMQRARDVGRRHGDRPRRLVRAVRTEQPAAFPMRVPAILDRTGFEGFGEVRHEMRRLAVTAHRFNRTYCVAWPVHLPIQPNTSSYHWTLFFGFSTQWFSSGKASRREGMLRRWSAVKAARPCV